MRLNSCCRLDYRWVSGSLVEEPMPIAINNASRIFNSNSHVACIYVWLNSRDFIPKPYMVCLSCSFPFDLSLSSIPTLLSAVTTISPSDGVTSLCVFVRYDAVPDAPLKANIEAHQDSFSHLSVIIVIPIPSH